MSIQKPDGTTLDARFNPSRVMSTDMNIAMSEFHNITQAAGYGAPKPVDRGEAPALRRVFKDNILARWRHNEVRTVPNASQVDLLNFSRVARREANIFCSRNHYLCKAMGYDPDVAYNDALMWTNTFLGRYRLRYKDTKQADIENRKLLTNYLRQRFTEVSNGLKRQSRNVVPSDAWVIEEIEAGVSREEPTPEWKAAHDEIGVKSAASRKAKAKELLNSNFGRIGHDSMIVNLKQTSETHPCVDTRRAANKYLREHVEECDSCKTSGLKVKD